MGREPLSREKIVDVLERRNGLDIPLVFHKWWGEGLEDLYGSSLHRMEAGFPDDIHIAFHTPPGDDVSPNGNPDYRWGYRADYEEAETHSIGRQKVLLDDWNELDLLLDNLPDPDEPDAFDDVLSALSTAGGRFKLGCWWRFLHERFWGIRGMENLMLDYFDEMDGLKRIGWKLVEHHMRTADRYAKLGFDGILVSDDLGHQTGPMMSPDVFRTLYQPMYKAFADHLHAKGMYFFLHTCGDNTLLLPMLVEVGVDVIHPIQKGCMDMESVARDYGDKITFLAGMDVQHILPEGSPDDVRAEIRRLIRIFHRPDGGLMLAAGNGILPDTPLENIRVMLDEMSRGD